MQDNPFPDGITRKTGVRFVEDIHQYFGEDGKRFAGVTSALGEFISIEGLNAKIKEDGTVISNAVLEGASERGTKVHKVIEDYINMQLGKGTQAEFDASFDIIAGDSRSKKSFEQYLKFEETFKPQYIASETMLASSEKGYAGTMDILAMIDGKLHLLDLKTGDIPKTVGRQSAGYSYLLRENTGYKGPIERGVIRLVGQEYDTSKRRYVDAPYEYHSTVGGSDYFKDTDEAAFLEDMERYKASGMKEQTLTREEALSRLIENVKSKGSDWSGYIKANDQGLISDQEAEIKKLMEEAIEGAGYKMSMQARRNGKQIRAYQDIPFDKHSVPKTAGVGAVIGTVAATGFAGFHNMKAKEGEDWSYAKSATVGAVAGSAAALAFRNTSLLTDVVERVDEHMQSGFKKAKEGSRAAREVMGGMNVNKSMKTVLGALKNIR